MDLSPASLIQNIAQCKSHILDSLFSGGASASSDLFASLLTQKMASGGAGDTCPLSAAQGANATTAVAANGRNVSLFDPESAYKMMSFINNRDVLYQAQYSELGQMSSGLAQMQAAAQGLSSLSANSSANDIANSLQHFVDQYNHWRQTFNGDVQAGGLLAGTQAAEVSLYELEQSAKNRFFGAQAGVHGLADLGISIDANSHLATLDNNKLNAMLSANPQGGLSAIQDFSSNFAKSAGLLNAQNNFIPNQLANLGRAIHYISDNRSAWTQEFGSGDPAQAKGKVAEALAAYQRVYG